jgi:hypothetical protein
VYHKRQDMVELLLTSGCTADILDKHDRTPFLVACQYGWALVPYLLWLPRFEAIAGKLVEHGCDTTAIDDCGRWSSTSEQCITPASFQKRPFPRSEAGQGSASACGAGPAGARDPAGPVPDHHPRPRQGARWSVPGAPCLHTTTGPAGPGESVSRTTLAIPRTELPICLTDFLLFRP